MSGSDSARAAAPAADGAAPDLRLLPVLVGLWLGIACALAWRPTAPLRLALLAVVVVVVAGAALVVGLRGAGPTWTGRRLSTALFLVAGAVGLIVGALHVQRLAPALIQVIVAESAVVRIEAIVTGDPEAHQSAGPAWHSAPTWTANVRVLALTYRAREYRVVLPVVVRGPGIEQLEYGAKVQLSGRAGPSWSPESSALSVQVLGPVSVRAPPGKVAAATNHVRSAFRRSVAGLPADAGALLLGLAVGDESLLAPDLDEAMVRAGLAHLTAVSGSNTSLVVGLALGAVIALGVGWRLRAGSALLVLSAYVVLVRPQPSVLRAAAMGCVGLLALTAGGRRRGPPALLAASIVLLVISPAFAVSWGFALSVAATAGLLLIGPGIAAWLARARPTRRMPDPVRAAIAVAAAAHLATLPLAVGMGNGASLVALPANVIVTPVVPFATVVGLAAALLAPLLPPVAVVLAWVGAPATALVAWVARRGSALPLGVVELPDGWVGSGLILMLLLVVAGIAVRGWRPWRDRRIVALAAALAVGIAATARVRDVRWPPPQWVVLACDVGQGDGVLLRAPGADRALLVDVGPTGSDAVGCARDAGIREVLVVLTHFHADHIDGLSDVLHGIAVAGVITTPTADPLQAARHVLELARAAGVEVRTMRTGDRVSAAGMELSALWPARAMPDPNNASLVLLARIPVAERSISVLLTGDVEPEAQAALLGRGVPQVDVVKVPHHGSAHQDSRLARTASPHIALMSVGAGNDGHPAAPTIAAYRSAGAVVGRTDTQGALAVVSGPDSPRLITQRFGEAG